MDHVLTEVRGRIGLITLNKPEKLNAWDRPMRSAIVDALKNIIPEFTPQYSFNGTPPIAFQRVRPDLFPPSAVLAASNVVTLKKQ